MFKKHKKKIAKIRIKAREAKPRYLRGASVYYVAKFFWEGITEGDIGSRAASVSYRTLMAFVPTVIFFLSIIPFLPIDNLESIILGYLDDIMPDMAYLLLESTVEDLLNKKYTTIMSFSIILGIYYAANTFNAYIIEFNSSPILLKKYGFFTGMLISIILVFFFAIFMFVAVIILIAGNFILKELFYNNIISLDLKIFFNYFQYFVAYLLFLISISVLYYAGDPHKGKFRIFTPGALVASVLVIISSALFAWFVNNFGNYNKLYGSLGAFFVALLWLYFNNILIILGFELNTSIRRANFNHLQLESEDS
jgi:membrane protein